MVASVSAWLARNALAANKNLNDAKIAALSDRMHDQHTEQVAYQARNDECLRHIEASASADAQNLEIWKLKYATEYGQITGKVDGMQGVVVNQLAALASSVQELLVKMSAVQTTLKMQGDK